MKKDLSKRNKQKKLTVEELLAVLKVHELVLEFDGIIIELRMK